jgi:hypothetical protein
MTQEVRNISPKNLLEHRAFTLFDRQAADARDELASGQSTWGTRRNAINKSFNILSTSPTTAATTSATTVPAADRRPDAREN